MFTGYSSGGLADLFDEEEAARLASKHARERRGNAKRLAPATERECVICGEVFYSSHSTQKTCSDDCSSVLKRRREHRKDAEYHRRRYDLRLKNQRAKSVAERDAG